jgi:nucleoid-associated protein YgaU
VRPGDSLWAIAERTLPASADDAAVDARWRRIHRLNATRVPDPDLIRPGTVLRVPGH